MKIAVEKNPLGGQILYRSLDPSKKRRHSNFQSGNDDAVLAGLTTIYPGDWEDVLTGATNLGYSVCSVDASPEWSNQDKV